MSATEEKINIYVECCHPEAKLPAYARVGDAGMDLYTIEEQKIQPGQTVLVRTGLKVAIPVGYELQVRPRSGLSLKSPLRIANSPGTIDAGYRDEICVIVHNTSLTEEYRINKGERIAQLVLQKVPVINWVPVEDVEDIGENRGGGFGSSGK
jgi:dUTP pyrophosphatase